MFLKSIILFYELPTLPANFLHLRSLSSFPGKHLPQAQAQVQARTQLQQWGNLPGCFQEVSFR